MGLSVTDFAVLRLVTDRQTDRRNWFSKIAKGGNKCIDRQKPEIERKNGTQN